MSRRVESPPDVRAALIAKYLSLMEQNAGQEVVPRFGTNGQQDGVYVRPHRRLIERLRAGGPVELDGWAFPEAIRRQLRLDLQHRYRVDAEGTITQVRRPVL